MKSWFFLCLLLLAGPVAAQRPTAEVAPAPVAFWPLEARTGAVLFSSPAARPQATTLQQAEHLRAWLTATCSAWQELQTKADTAQLYQAQLPGVHAGVALRFVVRLSRRPAGWQYQLLLFQVRSPTGSELVHWLPLHRVLTDPDFGPDVTSFQLQLQRALPGL